MADWTRRERTTIEVEYALDLPTNWAEVGKVYSQLNGELGPGRSEWDDAVKVTSNGDQIVFSYVKEDRHA